MRSKCSKDPKTCAKQVAIQVLFIIASIASLSLLSDKEIPTFANMALFATLSFLLMFGANLLSDDMSDKLLYPVLAAVAARLFSVLVPQYVAW